MNFNFAFDETIILKLWLNEFMSIYPNWIVLNHVNKWTILQDLPVYSHKDKKKCFFFIINFICYILYHFDILKFCTFYVFMKIWKCSLNYVFFCLYLFIWTISLFLHIWYFFLTFLTVLTFWHFVLFYVFYENLEMFTKIFFLNLFEKINFFYIFDILDIKKKLYSRFNI